MLKKLFSYFPIIRCPICGGLRRNKHLCRNCVLQIESLKVKKGYCVKCGELLIFHKTNICGECLMAPRPWDFFSFYGYYRGVLKEIIKEFKYQGDFSLVDILGDLLCQAYAKGDFEFRPDIIVPVPIHKNRLKLRGFNQSLEISRRLSKVIQVPIEKNTLIRIKDTIPQVGLKKSARKKNVRNVFCVLGDVRGANLILVDDVYTSGATVSECARVLKGSGAKVIGLLVLARTNIRNTLD